MIQRIDHFVLTVSDLSRTVDFYVRGLGMRVARFGENRTALQFGQHKINLHEAQADPILPRAEHPEPGTADFCLIAGESLEELEQHLRQEGFTIELGPVPRNGAIGPMRSLYLRDPDQNLVEIAEYLPSAE